MGDLPVFAFCEPEVQAEQVKTYLKAFGADKISEQPRESVIDNLNEIIDHLQTLKKVDDVETEAVLNSVVSMFTLLSRDQAPPVLEKFCKKVSSPDFAGKEAVVIRALSNIFHAFGDGSAERKERYREQYLVYCTMLKIAEDAGLIRMMITDLDRLNKWFETWSVSVEERRRCLRLLHDALVKGQQVEAPAKVMYELLSTYTTETDAATAKDDARQCIRSALFDPGAFVFDHLLSLKPVQSLKGEKIYDLLQIFVSGSLKDYLQFYESNKAFIDDGLGGGKSTTVESPHTANVHKMRVLTLMGLGESRSEIALPELSQELRLDNGEELEEFIIKCIQSKAIKAKIDQMSQKLIIGGVRNRSFGKPQWESLKNKLETWSSSLRHVKRYLDTVGVMES